MSGPFSCLSPFPVYRCRIKINYGSILTQHLVSCQLDYTIYPIFIFLLFIFLKFFKNFFKFLPLSGSLFYRSAFYRSWSFVLWQLKNIHHHVYGFWWVTPCLWSVTRLDWIAHSAARQRGRGGRRRRWWKVCVDLITNFERRNFMNREDTKQQALFAEYPDIVNVASKMRTRKNTRI